MAILIGWAIVLAMVFGGFLLAGGNFEIILHSLPFEFMIIFGGACGAYVVANRGHWLKATLTGLKTAFKGSKFKKKDYIDLLCLLYQLIKMAKQKGLIAIEPHIENPAESEIFQKYPKIMHDHFAVDLICDTFRMVTMSLEDPHQIENHMERQIEKHHHEALHVPHALQGMSDGLPAIGIVAAVLGVIKTMGHIDAEVTVLGGMIGGALVGTFLGVFLSYLMVGPISSRLTEITEEDGSFYNIIRDVMVGYLHGQAVQIAVENGRASVPTILQPTFFELEEAFNNLTT
ncbi:MAG: flagellar motor stator protein MotA [Alphaproteobacteria bacterium CG11_big_fil_rev_8_21_14_0_20_44_7]|nr:MAG: flagellar motor stator protein MotA [Alphaproteobacteria bacterium CG11_big_fil_rev_8_21_14_0_20_44_7]